MEQSAIEQAGISAIGTHLWNCECGEQFEEDCKEFDRVGGTCYDVYNKEKSND